MRTLLLLLFLLMFASPAECQSVGASDEGSAITVLGFKWAKTHLTVGQADSANPIPAAAMIPANKNFERNRRVNDPAGVRDPNLDTIDGRAAALEKSVQESRAPKLVEGFAYRVKVQNAGKKGIDILFFEYQFIDQSNPANVARRQFLCDAKIKPDKERELLAYSFSGPSVVVSAGSSSVKSGTAFQEKVIINRVEYSDGTIWQRKDWNFGEIRLTYKRAVQTPWGTEMCRGL